MPHVRDMYGQLSSPGRPAAAPGPVPVRDAHQGLAHRRHALVPAVREQRAPRGRRHPVQLHDLALRPGDRTGLQRGHQVVRLARGYALGGQERESLNRALVPAV
ncbi:hypothetical protein OIE62_41660 (plasmid) [Streptomyces scopuliridis]|uniref:Uncharacterized protein n=3 Tax=Streptomyces scopuliridis TaxID=452529 RepID=A0ACD4ZYX1_9ACTN|nr:hypothetical protein [Streptomyces scopuliridis]WSC02867.1 hypothetical protein OG835_41830 [Streptomyces scopuliridis]WSC03446.1 hypothetical protein OG835_41835 [Streptomyces scopuliridis]WSC03569.1 hypothetical protein OG835_42575 [Streptomyces scopuliridis]WSC03599.1 hypothetical protein OIE62_00005 [Streptomyces scopuliridis]WSC11287.1 hypothetical protein OIE62_40920 [Streptomyces scopuliridis]